MTELGVEANWSEKAKALDRIYQSLKPAVSELPDDERIELARQLATDLVFVISTTRERDISVEIALSSISAVCQSCMFERTIQTHAR